MGSKRVQHRRPLWRGITVTRPGLIKQLKLRGFAPGGPLEIKFRVIRPVGDAQWQAVSTPLVGTLPAEDAVHTYTLPDPRAMRVQPGDLIGVFQQGNGGAGTPWQIFSRQPGWTLQKVAINDGYKDGDLSPLPTVDLEGNSTVTYRDSELLLQAVESPDLCPGTDLPQQPCQSKLYLGGQTTGRATVGRPVRYTFTVRNGGPHTAAAADLNVYIPRRARVLESTLPSNCQHQPGPPQMVLCHAGELAAPQLSASDAVERISFSVVPQRPTKHFRALAQIDAPGVDDPQGAAHHLKTISQGVRASERPLGERHALGRGVRLPPRTALVSSPGGRTLIGAGKAGTSRPRHRCNRTDAEWERPCELIVLTVSC